MSVSVETAIRLPSEQILAERLDASVGKQVEGLFASLMRERKQRVEFLTADGGSDERAKLALLKVQIATYMSGSSSAMTDVIAPEAWKIMQLDSRHSRGRYENFQITCYDAVEKASARWWQEYLRTEPRDDPSAFRKAKITVIKSATSALRRRAEEYERQA